MKVRNLPNLQDTSHTWSVVDSTGNTSLNTKSQGPDEREFTLIVQSSRIDTALHSPLRVDTELDEINHWIASKVP